MAEYKAFNEHVEVNKETILSVINSMERGKHTRSDILEKNGIYLEEKDWFKQQLWLNAFKDIAKTLGDMNLFLIGKAIIDNAKFPPVKDLEEALNTLDIAYHMNHRLDGKVMFDPTTGTITEGIGNYKLVNFDGAAKQANIHCITPYPCKFDEGIITQITRRFRPADSTKSVVKLDPTKECKKDGGETSSFIISW